MPSKTKSTVTDSVRQFPKCRCDSLKQLCARCVETLLRENPELTFEVQDSNKGWPQRDRTTAICSRTESGNLRVCIVKATHKMPLVITGRDYDAMLAALRIAARSHGIKVELN